VRERRASPVAGSGPKPSGGSIDVFEDAMPSELATTLITKLMISNVLDEDDIRAIRNLPIRTREVGADHTIISEGDRPQDCCLLSEGFAFRSRTTLDGLRQILSLHIPGEIPDLQSLHLRRMDHDLTTLTPCTLGLIPHDAVRHVTSTRPNVAAALWRETLIDAAIFREWVVDLGRRSATARMGHFLNELYSRLKSIGRAKNGMFELPITQTELADCLGLSTVHVNRVLQDLRKQGLLKVTRSEFHLLKQEHLKELAGFDPAYLHLDPAN
jgi:CRP-like cAMP-binding protein